MIGLNLFRPLYYLTYDGELDRSYYGDEETVLIHEMNNGFGLKLFFENDALHYIFRRHYLVFQS